MLVTTSKLTDSKRAKHAKEWISNIIENIPDDSSQTLLSIRTMYSKRGLATNTGHAVVVVDGVVYDITSGQFDLPSVYPEVWLHDMWEKVRAASVELGDDPEEFYISEIKMSQILS